MPNHEPNRTEPTVTGPLLTRLRRDEGGFSTAELLGNAALGIIALVVIWGLLQQLGVDVVDYVRQSLIGS